VTCCVQVARCRSHHEAESSERASQAAQKIDELSRELLVEKQSSELLLADTAALRTKLLSAEVQLAEHAQSEAFAASARSFLTQLSQNSGTWRLNTMKPCLAHRPPFWKRKASYKSSFR
jgi:septal ring factor EnvC (AmiA/AmiB activator)